MAVNYDGVYLSLHLVHQLQHGQFVPIIQTVDERKPKVALETRPATVASAETIIRPRFEARKGKRIISKYYFAKSQNQISLCKDTFFG